MVTPDGRASWYVIAWRALWIVPLIVALGALLVVLAFMYGPSEARRMGSQW